MKKVAFLSALFAAFLFTSTCYAVPIFGITITYERGKSEWNADHTDTRCVGDGICKVSVKFTFGSLAFAGQLGNDRGKLVMSIPASYYESYPDDFAGGVIKVNCEIVVPAEEAQKIKFKDEIVVRPGKYKVVQDDESGNYFVYLTN